MIDLACAHQPAGVRAAFKFVIASYDYVRDVRNHSELVVRFVQIKEVGAGPWYCRPHEMTYYLPIESLAAVRQRMEARTVFEVEVMVPLAFHGAPVIQPLKLAKGGRS